METEAIKKVLSALEAHAGPLEEQEEDVIAARVELAALESRVAELEGALNDVLDNDGSRGVYEAISLGSAHARAESVLSGSSDLVAVPRERLRGEAPAEFGCIFECGALTVDRYPEGLVVRIGDTSVGVPVPHVQLLAAALKENRHDA